MIIILHGKQPLYYQLPATKLNVEKMEFNLAGVTPKELKKEMLALYAKYRGNYIPNSVIVKDGDKVSS